MVTQTFGSPVTTLAELRQVVGEPSERAQRKDIGRLDDHCLAFIARSPFALVATANAAGECDVSPRGDAPGFALVLDERTLALPERPGNRRIDTLSNIIENPNVGLIFLVPGVEETLRVNGRATLVRDPELLDRMAVNGRPPQFGLVVDVRQSYLHCAKSFKRARLWDPASQIPRDSLPSLARMIFDQTQPDCTLDDVERGIAASYEKLY